MITVKIGDDRRDFEAKIDPQWINQHINQRRAEGLTVCVQVVIDHGGLHLPLATPTCGFGGRGTSLSAQEHDIVDLWVKHGLNQTDFTGGNLVAFLQQIKRFL